MQYLPEIDCDIPDVDLLSLLFQSAHAWAEDETVIYAEAGEESNCMTKAATARTARRLAYALRHGLGVGAHGPEQDVVTCVSSNQVLMPVIFFATIAANGIYSAASTALTVSELSRQIRQSNSKLIVTSEDTLKTALSAGEQCGIPPERVLILRSMGHERQLTSSIDKKVNYLSETRELPWDRITTPEVLKNRVIGLIYSSGTTGVPKGVCLSHRNFVTEAIITQAAIQMFLSRTRRQLNIDFEYRTLAHLPTAHIAGLQGYFINGIMAGGTVFWMPKFVFEDFVHAAKKYQITFLTSAPPVYLRIVKSTMVTDHFDSLIHAQAGAAPMGPELQQQVQKKLKCNVSQAWGLTETTGAFTWLPWDRCDLTASIGQLLPNTRMKIVDDSGVPVQEGQRGEILVKGPNVTMGYFQNPEASAEAFTGDGWFRTGDIGLRKDGLIYIVDRKKELIKYKGLQISPAEIEALLVAHDRILDAAVVAVQDPKLAGNELPRAFIVRAEEGLPIQPKEIQECVKEHLSDHKQLRGGIYFIDQIPRNLSGKILRRALVDRDSRTESAKL